MSHNPQLSSLDEAIKKMSSNPCFDNAYSAIGEVVKLLDPEFVADFDHYKAFTNEKVQARSGWFVDAPGTSKTPTTFNLLTSDHLGLEVRLYWVRRTVKSVINGSVAFTPNYEDNPAIYPDKNVGIDIFIPETANKLYIVVSNKLSTRVLELSDRLTPTSYEVLKNWLQSFSSKQQMHAILWDSFNLSELNKKFYLQIASYFNSAVSTLTTKGVKENEAKVFTSRLIGRLLFCWFIKKAGGIIDKPEQYFTPRTNATEYYHTSLRKLFFGVFNTPKSERKLVMQKHQQSLSLDITGEQASLFEADMVTPYLNGGLFEASDLDECEDIVFSDSFFNDFYEFLNEYNFTTDESTSDFEQIAVDPEMLGRIFENLLAEQNSQTKKAASERKSKGTFYTPRVIVDFMCKESLKTYLKSYLTQKAVPEADVAKIINSMITLPEATFVPNSSNERTHNLAPYRSEIIGALDNVKILDPACGSGAFPMGMLQLLMQCYERTISEAKFNAYDTKLGIIQRSLYGVDIEPMAIEIARLRAWLSLVVEKIEQDDEFEALPNYDFKFVCANSLIALKNIWLDDRSLYQSTIAEIDNVDPRKSLKEDRASYYKPDEFGQEKNQLRDKIKSEISELKKAYEGNFGHGLAQLLSTYDPFDHTKPSGFFDVEFMFDQPDGFDIVIGNPPYVGEKGNKEIFRPIAETSLGRRFYLGKMDLFYFFFHLGLDLLREGGVLNYITTNYFITATGAKKLISDIKERTTIIGLINFNELKIFESALGQHNMITILQKGKFDKSAYTINTNRQGYLGSDVLMNIIMGNDKSTEYANIPQALLFSGGNIVMKSSPLEVVLDKIKKENDALSSICDVNNGIFSGGDFLTDKKKELYNITSADIGDGIFFITNEELEKLKINEEEKAYIKPLFKNSDIKKYYTNNCNHLNVINLRYTDRPNLDDLPNIKRHLERYKALLTSRPRTGTLESAFNNGYWYVMSTSRRVNMDAAKIVVPQRSPMNTFGYNEIPWYASADVYFITNPKMNYGLKLLLGILNSQLIYEWLYNRGKRKGEMLELYWEPLSQIPIPKITSKNLDLTEQINKLVDKVINAKKQDIDMDITLLQSQIDQLVYKLYGLTSEEIQLIESVAK